MGGHEAAPATLYGLGFPPRHYTVRCRATEADRHFELCERIEEVL